VRAAVLSLLRHVLTAAAGYAAAKGWLDEAGAHEAAGAVAVLAAAVWSALERRRDAARAP
jgi:hypothetical protein